MWDLPLFAEFIFVLLPLVVVVLIISKLIKIAEYVSKGDFVQSFSLIPYMVIIYYMWLWFRHIANPESLGYVNGTFRPQDVMDGMGASSTFLIGEALPTCMAVILIWGVVTIISANIPASGGNR